MSRNLFIEFYIDIYMFIFLLDWCNNYSSSKVIITFKNVNALS